MSELHWALQREQPRKKSEDESDDEDDNRLRQEYYCYSLYSIADIITS